MTDSTDDIAAKYGNQDSTAGEAEEEEMADPVLGDDSLGHVALKDSQLFVGRSEMQIIAYIDQHERDGLRVGNYVCIPYPDATTEPNEDEVLLAAIDRLEYRPITEVNDWVDGGGYSDFGEQNLAYVSHLDPIAIVKHDRLKDTLTRQTVDRPPKPGEDVHLIEDEEILRVGLNIPSDGIYIGDMAVSGDFIPNDENPLTYLLSNPNSTDGTADEGEPAIFRHLLVAGSTGKGKTHFSKNILRQCAVSKQYPIEVPPEEQEAFGIDDDIRHRYLNLFVIDPEDEYVEMRDDNPGLSPEKARELEDKGVAVGGLDDDLQVFAPVTANSQPTLDDIRTFGIPFSVVEKRPQLLLSSRPKDPTFNAIRNVLNAYFGRFDDDSNDEPTYNDFETWLELNGDQIVNNDNILAAVERRVTGPIYDRVFDHGSTSLDEYTNDMFNRGQVTVVPTGHLRGETEKLVLLALMTHIVENKIDTGVEHPQIKGTPMLLCVDEAHEYLSSTDRPREKYLVQNFRQAAKRGRKDKFGLYMVTQNPQDIDDEILKQTNTRIYLGLQPEVVERIRIPADYEDQIVTFDKGQAVVDAPDVRPVEVQGLDVCVTNHSN
ncbi:ATP-binding protein [Halorubrum ezzemoulense]|uniref:ATP-binding protein n=1 Tax=Halorubrum ezzemoulense TaxID=337243 RepID=UPI00232E9324|nr:ATP-binding protein [Halorubrum ezzemoulense]MDB2274333.1 ATP-binding protein [Halorubrum ezzemoulense]